MHKTNKQKVQMSMVKKALAESGLEIDESEENVPLKEEDEKEEQGITKDAKFKERLGLVQNLIKPEKEKIEERKKTTPKEKPFISKEKKGVKDLYESLLQVQDD